MNYEKFAYLYDQLMADAPYDDWVSFILSTLEKYGVEKGQLLDVGCGTGNISIPLSKLGFNVTAVDLSEEMLIVAQEKSQQAETSIDFFHQDMRELQGLGLYGTIISLCDSLNYLNDEREVERTFENIYEHLENDGIFIFDVHSCEKIVNQFIGKTFADNGEYISYIWECFEGDTPYSVEHDLSFFARNEKGDYKRFDELHRQRTYPISFFLEALKKVGFEVLSVTSDFSSELLEDGERLFFVAQK